MSGNSKDARKKLVNIAEFLAEDVLGMSQEEVEKTLTEEGLSVSAAVGISRAAFESANRELNAARFAAARREVADLKAKRGQSQVRIDPAQAKQVLNSYLARNPDAASVPTTMAARKGGDMSDDTALEIVRALIALGKISEDGEPL